MWTYRNTSELCHYGKKGMKWGVVKKTDDVKMPRKNTNKSENDVVKVKVNRRSKLEKSYEEKGFAKDDAIKLADNRIKTEKLVAAMAAVTVVAATAYVANKHINYKVDGMIKSDKVLQRVASGSKVDLNKNIYVSTNKRDNLIYAGKLSSHRKDPHKILLKTTSNIKVASRKSSEDAFVNLLRNDKEFRDQAIESIKEYKNEYDSKIRGSVNDFLKMPFVSTNDKFIRKDIYDAFNIALPNNSKVGRDASQKFYDTLKTKGYDALLDVNDIKYSGYKSKKPTILFNAAATLKVDGIEKLMKEEISDSLNKTRATLAREEKGKKIIKPILENLAIAGVSGSATTVAVRVASGGVVKNYRKENPNSGLTDKQIIEILAK